jgi:hypothetical protein
MRFAGLKHIFKIHLQLHLEAYLGGEPVMAVRGEDVTKNIFETGK